LGELISQHWQHLIDRIEGLLNFRLIVQPLVAAFLGVRAGSRDARQGRHVFGWHLLTTRLGNRGQLIRDGWSGKLFFAAIVIDAIYQLYVLRWLHPGQAVIVAIVLALRNYVVFRGLTNRMAGLLIEPPRHNVSPHAGSLQDISTDPPDEGPAQEQATLTPNTHR
jgi:hypothetical protein